MPETRRLCRQCYKRRKLDATGRCRHCNPLGTVVGAGPDNSSAAIVATSGSLIPPTITAPTTKTASTLGRPVASPPPPSAIRHVRSAARDRSYSGSDSGRSNHSTKSDVDKLSDSDSTTSISAQPDNRAIQQMQMFSDFFHSHLPAASAAEVGRARSISYLANIPFINISSPLLSAAVDALCLAHVGSTRQDVRLLHASQNSYGAVLASIRRLLSSSTAQTLSSREIVMAIMIISLFDECMPLQHRASNSSMTHLWGAQQYLTATPPSQFDLNHPLDRTLILNVFQNGFWLALAKRQRVGQDRSKWTAIQDTLFPSRTPYTVLALLPSLLERTDLLLNQDEVDLTDLTLLCNELDDVRHNIFTRMQNDRSAVQPELVHITDSAAFDTEIEEHRHITSSHIFPSHCRFPSPEPAVNWACRAIIFLVIDCTLLRIFHFRPVARALPARRQPREVECDASSWAAQLCQSVYQFSQLRSMAYVDFLLLFMELAHNFYQEKPGAEKEADWCRACLAATQARLDRLRVHRPPTLCRLGDLPAGIRAAGRYRSARIDISETSKATTDQEQDFCPVARASGASCPVTGAAEPYVDFSAAPSMSSSSTTASSVSPALSMVVPKMDDDHHLGRDLKQEWRDQ